MTDEDTSHVNVLYQLLLEVNELRSSLSKKREILIEMEKDENKLKNILLRVSEIMGILDIKSPGNYGYEGRIANVMLQIAKFAAKEQKSDA